MEWPEALDLGHLILGILAAGALGLLLVVNKEIKSEVTQYFRKLAGEAAQWESQFGLSPTMTAPATKLATGDLLGAATAWEQRHTYLALEANRATEVSSVWLKQYTTNSAFADAFDKLYADTKGGASAATIQGDVQALGKALPLLPALATKASIMSDLGTELAHFMAGLQGVAASAGNPVLATAIAALNANPATAALAHLTIPALIAGHDVGQAAAASTAQPTAAPPANDQAQNPAQNAPDTTPKTLT